MNTLKTLVAAAAIGITGILGLAATTANDMNNDNNTTPTAANEDDVYVAMETTMGPVTLMLYGDTPRHLANFVKLVNEGYYNGLLFHRVINEFMIQGGDPDSRNAAPGQMLGEGDPDYKIDAEFVPRHFHKRGALAAAREGDQVNPTKKSSGSQFYIVTGKTYTPAQLDQMNARRLQAQAQGVFNNLVEQNRDTIMTLRRERNQPALQALQDKFVAEARAEVAAHPDTLTEAQRQAYSTVGGTPHLDGSYTVFGEVVSGMDTVDKIQKAETDSHDRPTSDIRIISARVIPKP